MDTARLERGLERVGLLGPASYVYNSALRRRCGPTLSIDAAGRTARFYTEGPREFAHVRNFWLDELGGEREVLEAFVDDLRPDDVVYDIGANVGTYTCFAQQIVTQGEVHAFEPHPDNAARLADNLRATGDRGVTRIHQVAIAAESGTLPLAVGGSVVGKGTHNVLGNGTSSIPVDTERLDDYADEHGLPGADVLKIDVEGAEGEVFEGASETLREVRVVYVEVHPQHGVSLAETTERLEEAGLAVDTLEVRGDQPYLRAVRPEDYIT